jgi:adenosylmethionine-8-amino-7-oxononanoate aminotransferase
MENQSSLREIDPTYLFNQSLSTRPRRVVENGIRHTYYLENKKPVHDFSSGSGSASLGRYQKKVEDAIVNQFRLGTAYVPSLALDTPIAEDLARMVVQSTGGAMTKAVFYCSGINSTSLRYL